MKYVLCKVSVEPNRSCATLWYANPDCVFEKPHKIMLFNDYQISSLMRIVDASNEPINPCNVPLDMIPEQFKEIHAEYVEVHVGLHRHVTRKTMGRPVYTRCIYVFSPMVQKKSGFWDHLYDPRQLAQEQINRYWVPVDED